MGIVVLLLTSVVVVVDDVLLRLRLTYKEREYIFCVYDDGKRFQKGRNSV